MKKLTPPQTELYNLLKLYMTTTAPMHYDNLKNLCEFKTFDATFGALFNKGLVKRFKEGNGENTYIIVK